MRDLIHVAFCADRRVLPGLHVAAYSVVANHRDAASAVYLHVFSNDLTEDDIALLQETLRRAGSCSLRIHAVSNTIFEQFPSMSGSSGAYYRLLVPEMLAVEKIIYLDVDILCCLDVGDFLALDLGNHPAGFVAETTIGETPDRSLAERLSVHWDKPYLNSGVMVVNRKLWRERKVTERCLAFLQQVRVDRWDQSALNYVLVNDWKQLDNRFNFISNWRQNWASLAEASKLNGNLVHFLDNPKPWDFFGEFVHPHYQLWRSVLNLTAMKGFKSWHNTPSRNLRKVKQLWTGYKKAIKDRILFSGYSRGWLKKIKGVSPVSQAQRQPVSR